MKAVSASLFRRILLVSLSCTSACALFFPLDGFDTPPALETGPDGALTDAGSGPVEAATVDAAPPTDPDLVGEWLFDEGQGTVARDSRGTGPELTLKDARWTTDGWRGGAITFNGAATVVGPSLERERFPRSGTLSMHFRRPRVNDTANRALFSNFGGTSDHLFLRHPNGTTTTAMQVGFQIADAGYPYAFAHNFEDLGGQWRHVVITWSEPLRSGSLYLEGVEAKKAAYGVPFVPTGQDFTIGSAFIGEVDDVRLYSRALDAYEVTKLP